MTWIPDSRSVGKLLPDQDARRRVEGVQAGRLAGCNDATRRGITTSATATAAILRFAFVWIEARIAGMSVLFLVVVGSTTAAALARFDGVLQDFQDGDFEWLKHGGVVVAVTQIQSSVQAGHDAISFLIQEL